MDTQRDAHRGGLNQALAAVIQSERAKWGLTIDQVADLSGIGRQTLLRRLGGKARSDINVNEVAQLAAVFKLTPAQMIEEAEEWQRRSSGHNPAETQETAAQIVRNARDTARNGNTPDISPGAGSIPDVKRRRRGPAK